MQKFVKVWLLCFGFFAFGVFSGAWASSEQSRRTQAALQQRIDNLSRDIAGATVQSGQLRGQLADLEKDAGRIVVRTVYVRERGQILADETGRSLSYLDGITDDLDRLDAILGNLQNRDPIRTSPP